MAVTQQQIGTVGFPAQTVIHRAVFNKYCFHQEQPRFSVVQRIAQRPCSAFAFGILGADNFQIVIQGEFADPQNLAGPPAGFCDLQSALLIQIGKIRQPFFFI